MKDYQDIRTQIIVFYFVIGVLLLWFILGYVSPYIFGNIGLSGQIGDSFGSANALFSGLAFVGLIYTIILQQRQISLQREQFQYEIEANEMSKNFSLLNKLFDEIKDDLDNFEYNDEKGQNALKEFCDYLFQYYDLEERKKIPRQRPAKNENESDSIDDSDNLTVDAIEYLVKQIHSILKITDNKRLEKVDKEFVYERIIFLYKAYLQNPLTIVMSINNNRLNNFQDILEQLDRKIGSIELKLVYND
jgi:hypothetical protein